MEQLPDLFNRLVADRRSVFPVQFDTSRKVADDIIEQVLINATWAPNHGQSEPWFFKVFTGKGLERFAEIQSRLYAAHAGSQFKKDKFEKLLATPLLASHVISIGMKRTTTKQIPEIEDVEAVACAVQNIYLSVQAYGLGGYWTSGGVTYFEQAKEHFGLGEQDRLLGFFYIGHVKIPSPSAKRAPIDQKTEWVRE
ncbi:MAG: nitroreductase [Bacteroidota bacterium]